MRLGLLAILLGSLFLLKNLGYIFPYQWDILWPLLVIIIGIAAVGRDRCWHCGVWHDGMKFGSRGALCKCDCDECEDCGSRGSSSKCC